ncbi:hypothetical protein [Pseudomonas sp. FP2300]|uniref:hypothetical protein n=1 Tax=Pseudomonas sp. FP2300 TaxID=2954090 RepID=UPI002733DAED|nr:hypothetical protein [Pseudomonas sp. FP2300]WLH64846.1 hypothetical protein PSH86_09860 [Pseudomonas sp. FP2300]
MGEDRREQAIAAWRKALAEPDIRMDVENQYEKLARMADDLKQQGIIDKDDWRQMMGEAVGYYARSIEKIDPRS